MTTGGVKKTGPPRGNKYVPGKSPDLRLRDLPSPKDIHRQIRIVVCVVLICLAVAAAVIYVEARRKNQYWSNSLGDTKSSPHRQ